MPNPEAGVSVLPEAAGAGPHSVGSTMEAAGGGTTGVSTSAGGNLRCVGFLSSASLTTCFKKVKFIQHVKEDGWGCGRRGVA